MTLSEDEKTRVANWETVWDGQYGKSVGVPDPEFDISPWISSYTGEPIPAEQMREWVAASAGRVRSLLPKGGRILEIGCGTGLMLYRLLDLPSEYVGIDPSEQALKVLETHLKTKKAGNVRLLKKTAIELSEFAPGAFDVVFMNSVAQYFPSKAYMERVLEAAVALLKPTGSIFLGDVRNETTLRAFHHWARFQRAEPGWTVGKLKAMAERKLLQEREQSYPPEYFEDICRRLGLACSVQLRRGRFHNEMSCFRYDVTLSRAARHEAAPLHVLPRLPNARTWQANRLLELVQHLPETASMAEVTAALGKNGGIEPEGLWELGEKLGLETEIGFDSGDGFRAVLRRQ